MRRRPRIAKRPSQMAIRNVQTFWAGGTEIEQSVKRGRQPENIVNDEIAAWRNGNPTVFLARNKKRLVELPDGSEVLYGFIAPGSSDWGGWESVTVTNAMVGKKVAVAFWAETKRKDGGVVSDEQQEFLDRLRDDGGIAAVARSPQDMDDARARFYQRLLADER